MQLRVIFCGARDVTSAIANRLAMQGIDEGGRRRRYDEPVVRSDDGEAEPGGGRRRRGTAPLHHVDVRALEHVSSSTFRNYFRNVAGDEKVLETVTF